MSQHPSQNDEDDPNHENEAEVMLEYIEKFTELVEDKNYEEAALHAASSPKGILRTREILHRFKGGGLNIIRLRTFFACK